MVTSRDNLAGLVAVHGVRQIDLDLLPLGEAVGLLHRLIGHRLEAEPGAAVTLAEQCAGLPLALRVAAVLATSRPDRSLADVVAELADRQERLTLLDPGGDPYAAVHAVFSWSVQHLPEQAALVYRRLGLHPGPDLDQYVAAALTGLAPRHAGRVLERLVGAHLLHRVGSGRYGMHDLLRAYATHLAVTEDSDEDREAAEDRLFAYYQAAAASAMNARHPDEPFYRSDTATASVAIPDLTGSEKARGWLEAERSCVLAIAEHAADAGRSGYVVRLARTVHRYQADIHLTDLLTLNGHALHAAERVGDQIGQAHALRQLGAGYLRVGQHVAAIEHGRRALALFRQVGDLVGEALTLTNLGVINHQRGDHKNALDGFRQAIALSRQAGDRRGEAFALNSLGLVEARLGDHAGSVEIHQQALVIYQDLGSRDGEAVTLNNLANAELRRKRYPSAAEHLRRAFEILEDLGSHRGMAHTLDTLGTLHLRLKEAGTASKYFQQALVEFRRIGDRNGQAWSTNGLGEAAAQFAGDTAAALALHADALVIATKSGPRHQVARAHAGIGHARRAMGEHDLARTHYEHAFLIYTELDMPEAEDMRVRMEEAPAA